MAGYETPASVASALALWAPRKIEALLEPSVGSGALLKPLLPTLERCRSKVVCVDVESDCLERVSKEFGQCQFVIPTLVCGDFLDVELRIDSVTKETGFDCIVMNPPFSAKKENWREVDFLNVGSIFESSTRCLPLEGAFLMKAINLLRPGGRILAVLPASLVSGRSTLWFRDLLMKVGSIRCVHELPPFAFPRVEGHVYLFVYEKAKSSRSVVLCNHRLFRPERLILNTDSLGAELRLDYQFQVSRKWHSVLQGLLRDVEWTPLAELAEIRRGAANGAGARNGMAAPLHTTAFKDGFWRIGLSGHSEKTTPKISPSRDIYFGRVGRRCVDSIGLAEQQIESRWTDCIVRIRPMEGVSSMDLLFGLRCLLTGEEGIPLIRRGTGAFYIAVEDLANLSVPLKLASLYPKAFRRYQFAVQLLKFDRMRNVERFVQRMMRQRYRNSCSNNKVSES